MTRLSRKDPVNWSLTRSITIRFKVPSAPLKAVLKVANTTFSAIKDKAPIEIPDVNRYLLNQEFQHQRLTIGKTKARTSLAARSRTPVTNKC